MGVVAVLVAVVVVVVVVVMIRVVGGGRGVSQVRINVVNSMYVICIVVKMMKVLLLFFCGSV